MNTPTYYQYKDLKLSTKSYSDNQKVRIWENNGSTNSLKLKSTKIYNIAENVIERHSANTYSRIPMVNSATKDKMLDFIVQDGDFILEGKMRNGKICMTKRLQNIPVFEEEYKRLGNLALRFCKKLDRFMRR